MLLPANFLWGCPVAASSRRLRLLKWSFEHASQRQFLSEAGTRPGVADLALAQHTDAQQYRIPVAVGPGFNHLQTVAGTLSLGPQCLAGAAVERHEASAQGLVPSFRVHKTHHQELAGAFILNDSGRQALHLVEVDFHCILLISRRIIRSGTKAKSPLGELCASGLGFPMSAFWLSVVPRRHAHRMVMMVVAMGQRSHREHDIRAVEIWLSIGCYDENRPDFKTGLKGKRLGSRSSG